MTTTNDSSFLSDFLSIHKEFILILDTLTNPGSFLLYSFLEYYQQKCHLPITFCGFAQDQKHYEAVGKKMGVTFSNQLEFIDLFSQWDQMDDLTLLTAHLLKDSEKKCIIIDNLSLLYYSGKNSLKGILDFVLLLRDHVKKVSFW
jgi:hypothetical protein